MTDVTLKVLAVVGAAAVGAFGTGAAVRLVTRLMTTRNLPPTMLRILRLGGSVVLGWLTALWVFNGGAGFGTGGGGTGIGGEAGDEAKKNPASLTALTREKTIETAAATANGDKVFIEIIGKDVVKRAGGSEDRRFRVVNGKETKVLTLDELKAFLKDRRQGTSGLREITLVLYQDSPSRDAPVVTDLYRWIEAEFASPKPDEKIRVNLESRGMNAPAR